MKCDNLIVEKSKSFLLRNILPASFDEIYQNMHKLYNKNKIWMSMMLLRTYECSKNPASGMHLTMELLGRRS